MQRKQFYPSQTLSDKISEEARRRGVSESTLITDILTEYFGLNQSGTSLTDLTEKVLEEVSSYISTLSRGTKFDLNTASKTYRDISMAKLTSQGKIPQATRASIGRSFASRIGKAEFSNVRKAIIKDKDGNDKQQLSQKNNALMYEVY